MPPPPHSKANTRTRTYQHQEQYPSNQPPPHRRDHFPPPAVPRLPPHTRDVAPYPNSHYDHYDEETRGVPDELYDYDYPEEEEVMGEADEGDSSFGDDEYGGGGDSEFGYYTDEQSAPPPVQSRPAPSYSSHRQIPPTPVFYSPPPQNRAAPPQRLQPQTHVPPVQSAEPPQPPSPASTFRAMSAMTQKPLGRSLPPAGSQPVQLYPTTGKALNLLLSPINTHDGCITCCHVSLSCRFL